jgi:predicted small metal-binding protein
MKECATDPLYLNILSRKVNFMKTLSCREAGFDCDYVVKGETEEEILNNGKQHVIMDHEMKEEECTPQFKGKLRGLIKEN